MSDHVGVAGSRRRATEPRVVAVFPVLALCTGLYGMLVGYLAPVLPSLAASLEVDLVSANWLFVAFLLASAVTTPVVGRLGDVFGKTRMLIATLLIVLVGLVLSAVATSLPLMVVGRAVQGTMGGSVALCYGIARDEFPPARAATGIGLVSGFLGVGTGVGLVMAGPILEGLDAHWLYWVPAGIAVVVLVLTLALVPRFPGRARTGINWVGAVLMSACLTALLLGVSRAPTSGWDHPAVMCLLAASLVLAVAWLRSDLRSRNPLVDLRVMRLPTVWKTNLVTVLFGNGLFASSIIIPAFAKTPPDLGFGFAAAPTSIGLYLLPVPIGTLVFSLLSAPLTRRFGPKALLVASVILVTTAYPVFLLWRGHEWAMPASTGFVGIGSGLGVAAVATLIIGAVPASQTGIAAGMNGNARLLGQALGSAMITTILVGVGVVAPGSPNENGYLIASAVTGVLMVLAVALALTIPSTSPRPE